MFNEKNIAFTFSVMSDIHVSGSWYVGPSREKVKNGLAFAREVAKNNVDAYVFAGDFVDCMNSHPNVLIGKNWGFDYDEAKAKQSACEFEGLREIINNHIPSDAEIIYCLGNHDSIDCNNIDRFITEFSSRDEIGDGKNFERMYRTDLDLESMRKGMRHCVCKGYHFLCVDIDKEGSKTIEFLKKNLDEITAKEPDKYVFVVYHYKVPGTVYASEADLTETSVKIGELLKNYSQVVLITGHTHLSVMNERAIMQTEFTTLEASCVSYVHPSWPDKGLNFDDAEAYDTSEGMLFEIDCDGNIRIKRLEYIAENVAKNHWILPCPKADNSHLRCYSAQRKEQLLAPEFAENAEITMKSCDNGIEIIIPRAERNTEQIFMYSVTCERKDGEVKKYNLSSLYCYPHSKRYAEDTLSGVIPMNINEIAKITVAPQDFWFNQGKAICKLI